MDTERIIGIMALIITMVYMGLGIPDQIVKNFKKKSVEGLALVTYILMFLSCLIWTIYAAVKPTVEWFIFIPNCIGAICAAIILAQFRIYKKKGMKPGFIFDLDGLLVDTQLPFHAEAESRALAEIGITVSPVDISSKYAGISTKQVFQDLAPEQDAQALVNRKWEIMQELLKERDLKAIPWMFEVCEFLASKNVPMCIASASPRDWIELCLKQQMVHPDSGIAPTVINYGQIFGENFISAEECSEGKPSPEIIYKAMRKTGAKDVGLWYMVGDGDSDVQAGLNASVRVLFLSPDNNHYNDPSVRWFKESERMAQCIQRIITEPETNEVLEKMRRRNI